MATQSNPLIDLSKEPKSLGTAKKAEAAKRKKSSSRPDAASSARFFLVNSSSNGAPDLGQEFESENVALVEALKKGQSFASVMEWSAFVEVTKAGPVIRKEVLKPKKVS